MGRFSLTQRAYTFCLKGVPPEFCTRRKFWETHEIVNKGVRAFGNWLLTLRGGISHELADKQEERRRDKRILLAPSWLSVESPKDSGMMLRNISLKR